MSGSKPPNNNPTNPHNGNDSAATSVSEARSPDAVSVEGAHAFGVTPEEIDRLPSLPGVYMMKDAAGKILYIGKASNLRSRVRSYFTKAGEARFNVRFLMRHVKRVETIITGNEKEAFFLENTLIKSEQPRYNIRLRDDKTYVSVRIDLDHEWPRAVVMRRRNEKRGRTIFLGPYDSAYSVRETLRQLQRVFPIRSCSDSVLYGRDRACLLHQIGRCCAPCVEPVDRAEYREMVEGTILVLKGKTKEVTDRLQQKMWESSEAKDYERAGILRDRITAIERTTERQRVHTHDGEDRDVIVLERAGGRVAFTVFVYRNGLLLVSRPYILRDHDREEVDLMEEFISRYYESETPPREVLTDITIDNAELLNEWLTEKREAKCEIVVPQRGEKVRLIEVAHENCALLLEQHLSGRESREQINADLIQKFHLVQVPEPMECYDISTLQGFATVGSMVTFRNGEPDKSRYRHYKIKSIEGQDDFGSLREVLTRRFRKSVEKGEMLPGLVVIDGGKGQLAVAEDVFRELGITDVGLVGMAKSRVKRRGDKIERTEERFFLPGRKNPVRFPTNSPTLYQLQRLRDEAHRFGITHHRKLRRKKNLRSSLEDLPGVGKTRAAKLLRSFGSLKALREVSEEEIAAVKGIPKNVAAAVFEFLHTAEDKQATSSPESLR